MTSTRPSILIIGASRGLGLGLVQVYLQRGWQVVGTVRGDVQTALHSLAAENPALEIEHVDIDQPEEITALRTRLASRAFQVTLVNAGVNNDRAETIGQVSTDEFVRLLTTNALGPMRVVETLADLAVPGGVLAVMTSELASVGNNVTGGCEVYRASKAALNTLMRSYAARTAASDRTLLAIAPGWTRTDMGGGGAPLDIPTSTQGVADVIAARSGGPGLLFVDYRNEIVAW